jgi:photosystem II stability/assembly factor-like uncharacterized protein
VYASTQADGVLRSTDGGRTFSEMNTGLTTLRTSHGAGVLIDPRDSQVLCVGTEGGGVFESRDGGASWNAINQGLTNLNVCSAWRLIPGIRTFCTQAAEAGCSRRQRRRGSTTWQRDGAGAGLGEHLEPASGARWRVAIATRGV